MGRLENAIAELAAIDEIGSERYYEQECAKQRKVMNKGDIEIRIERRHDKWSIVTTNAGMTIFDATCYEYITVLTLLEALKERIQGAP